MNAARKTWVIGLLGLPASGKSTVAHMLGDRGGLVLDADRLVARAYAEPGVRSAVEDRLGPGLFAADGAPCTDRIADIVFGDPAERRALEEILHPVVRRRLQEQLASARSDGTAVVVLDVPLLAEGGLIQECNFILVVDTSPEVRRLRAASRGWDATELSRRDTAQWSLEEKMACAPEGVPLASVPGDGDREGVARAVEAIWNDLIQSERE